MLQIDKLLLKFSQNRIPQMVQITLIDISLRPGISIKMDSIVENKSQYDVKNVSPGEVVPCLIDTFYNSQ